jgi:putative FmdB family regulatory protein
LDDTSGGASLPLYEYKCLKCGRHTEKIESVSGPHLKKCPYCAGKVEAVITAPSIQFKGAGWYVTEYGGRKSDGGDAEKADKAEKAEKADKADKPATEAKETASKEKDSSGKEKETAKKDAPAKEGKEKKPAAKK